MNRTHLINAIHGTPRSLLNLTNYEMASSAVAQVIEIEKVADLIVDRGFGLAALFLLEMHRPLSALIGATSVVVSPILLPLVGFELFRKLLALLQHEGSYDQLMQQIEARLSRTDKDALTEA